MILRRCHRWLAGVLAGFVVLHLLNHLAIFAGAPAHLAVMEGLRPLYRHPLVEWPLLCAFGVQTGLGLRLAWRRGWPRSAWPRLQVLSGVTLGIFLIAHVGAALVTRMGGLDTNTYWAAAVVSRAPFTWVFVPYYTLGLFALAAHIAARRRSRAGLAAGAAVSGAIVAGFAGVFHPIDLPANYSAYLDAYPLWPAR